MPSGSLKFDNEIRNPEFQKPESGNNEAWLTLITAIYNIRIVTKTCLNYGNLVSRNQRNPEGV